MRYFREGMFFGQRTTLDRLYALTDGLYAIVITLLVLDLKVPEIPELTEAQLIDDLVRQIPNFTAYIISFYAAVLLWMRNHWILEPLKACNETTFWLQFTHLLFVSLIPYTTSLVGRYEEDPIGIILFSASLGLAGLSLLFLHRYVVTRKDWHTESATTKEWTNPRWLTLYPGPLFALGALLVSFINVTGALLLWFFLPIWSLLAPPRPNKAHAQDVERTG